MINPPTMNQLTPWRPRGENYGFLWQVPVLAYTVIIFAETENKQEYFEEISLPLGESFFVTELMAKLDIL